MYFLFCVSVLFICLSLTKLMDLNCDTSGEPETIHPCDKCMSAITYEHKGLQCDTCSQWFHASCQRVGDTLYDYLSNSSCSWLCTKCDCINYSLGSSQYPSSLTTNNEFSSFDSSGSEFSPELTPTPVKKKNLQRLLYQTNL